MCYPGRMNSAADGAANMARRILIVDDDTRLARIIAIQLRLSGAWQIVGSAAEPATALSLAVAERPDLVLLDLWLHGEHTLELLAQLRSLASPPLVVMLTAEPHPKWRERALAAGASAYLSKLEMLDIPALLNQIVSTA